MRTNDIYEKRFNYIDDENLRKHMWDAFRFVSEITTLTTSAHYSDEIKSSFIKTAILYTAYLVEANIAYCILTLWYTEFESSKEWEYKIIESLKKVNYSWEEIILCKRSKKNYKINKCDFNVLNNFAYKKINLYWESVFKEIDYIRKKRNKIHLMSLEDIDRIYSQDQMNRVFKWARDIFKVVEKKLKNKKQ